MKKLVLSTLVLFPALVFAAGPLSLEGPNGNTPVKYATTSVSLNLDIGMLGIKTNAEADLLFLDALNLWNSVATSSINLAQGNDLSVDVDINNYTDFIPAGFTDNTLQSADGLNPVIYDNNGAIIDAFFGAGQSSFIVGFATSGYSIGSSYYVEGYAVLNGKAIDGILDPNVNPELSDTQLTLLVAHEIGHFVGLDHTVLNHEEDEMNSCLKTQSLYPLMYPFVCRQEISLHQDDIISVSTLYPSVGINEQFGQINGHFIQVSGNAILGSNIFARDTSTTRVFGSVISDYLKQGSGFFSLYLPPGTYTLHANSLGTDFTAGSSVGPYADTLTDESFQSPNPINAVGFKGNTGPNPDPSLLPDQELTVTAGEATEVEFKLDGSGTFATGGEIFTPPIPVQNTDTGGSGSMAPVTLFLLLMPTVLLRLHRRFHRHRFQ